MRHDPARLSFEVGESDGAARTGVIHTGHGPVVTPAFVPLATSGTVRGLSSAEVEGLGYGMVLGNTYHLLVSPGPERIREAGGLHSFMGWDGAIITDSGGFQVFSLAHGGVADEIKGTGRRSGGPAETVSIEEQGVTFRSYRDGSLLTLSPESSMEVQAALGSDIALVFDECTPASADRGYTAASTERTHRWLDRCLAWHEAHGPPGQAVYGIVQGGVHGDLRKESVEYVTAAGVDGVAIGGTLGRDKEEMRGVLDLTMPLLPADVPRHLLGIGEIDDLVHGIALGVDTFDSCFPTRIARHGTLLTQDGPLYIRKGGLRRWWCLLKHNRYIACIGAACVCRRAFQVLNRAFTHPHTPSTTTPITTAIHSKDLRPIEEGCPCFTCQRHSRAYLNHLFR